MTIVTNCDTYFIIWCFVKVLLKSFHACNIIAVVLFVEAKNVHFVYLFVGYLWLVFFFQSLNNAFYLYLSVAANN